ncbi:extracellular solute-binding protein [Anaerosporobacter faecicola]|uniref:extracellular solute-binding protein n=1 Tax=Anaerosporobacter faecicola TaxID=2718714 RepID=UPI00143C8760|nr:extracellular solute-binding protein [Anaerosporobacter faecicola]
MKKKCLVFGLIAAMLIGSFTGCSSKKSNNQATENNGTKETTTETKETTDDAQNTDETSGDTKANVEPVAITVWHDGADNIMQTIQDYVNEQLSADQITVTFEKKTGLTDQLKLYGNDSANGPDLYFYAHDSLGMFAEMGILAPVTDLVEASTMGDFLPMTVDACTYKDTQYMMPVYFETLLFMYNKALWEGEVPSTMDEIYDYMVAHTDTKAGTYALVNQHSTAYNVAPIINGFGGYIINEDAKPGLNEQATKDAITYNKKFAELEADGDYNTVTTLFNEGKAAAIMGGPWLVSGIQEAGIDLGIKALSSITLPNGNALAPYSGVQGIGVLKYAAENKKEAIAKVLTAISTDGLGIALCKSANCAPANGKSYNDADVSVNEMAMAMRATASTAVPMPNIPEMSVMWGPAESLLAAVNKSGDDVEKVADQYQKDAETAIKDMQ